MSLISQIKTGKIKRPYAVLIYGVDGVGKTTFAAGSPKPVFLGPERGSNRLNVSRFPRLQTWSGIKRAVKELLTEPHDYKSLVIDSLDWIEPILHAYICERHGVKSIEQAAGGWGKGYGEATLEWQELIKMLDDLRDERGMNIIAIAHCDAGLFNDPQAQNSYNRYQLKLRPKDGALWREYVDAVLFANFVTHVKTENKKTRAVSEGDRVIYTDRRAGFDAKNRLGLPHEMALSWDEFAQAADIGEPESSCDDDAADIGEPESPDAIVDRMMSLLTQCADADLKASVTAYIEKNSGNAVALLAAENKLKLRVKA